MLFKIFLVFKLYLSENLHLLVPLLLYMYCVTCDLKSIMCRLEMLYYMTDYKIFTVLKICNFDFEQHLDLYFSGPALLS